MGAMCATIPMAPFQVKLQWKCDYCKGKVASHEEKCPNCGASKPEEKKEDAKN